MTKTEKRTLAIMDIIILVAAAVVIGVKSGASGYINITGLWR